jgi:hypothetical protein
MDGDEYILVLDYCILYASSSHCIPRTKEVYQMTLDRTWLEDKVEPLARMMAAEKMGLVKDKLGENQPYELWSQCIPDARRYLGLE